jgi:hypothetical protein
VPQVRFFLTGLRLELRGIFSWATAILLIILPLSVFAVNNIFADDADIFSARIGIVNNSDVALALPQLDNINFVVITGNAARMVATGELECAYILPTDLKSRVVRGDIHNAVEIITSPNTLLNVLADKWVFTAIIEALAPEIAAFELAAILDIPADDILPEILHGFESYAEGHRFVTTQTAWHGGGTESNQPAPGLISAGRVSHGLISLFMLAAMFLSLPAYLGVKSKMHTVLRGRNLCIYYGTVYIALFLRVLLVGIVGSFGLRLPLLVYALFCAAVGLLLMFILRSSSSVFVVGVFTILSCTLLGGVLVDPAELGGVFETLGSFMPTLHYINALI